MEIETIINKCESITEKKVTWYSECSFYADSLTRNYAEKAFILLTDVNFYIYCEDFEDSFTAIDVLYTDTVLKEDVIQFLDNKKTKVKRANPIMAIGKKTLLSLEFDNKDIKYLELKGQEFKQLLRMAQAKQKYSREININ